MIGNLLSATILPKVCVALLVACLAQLGVITWMSHTADTLRAEKATMAAKLELANSAVETLRESKLAAEKRAEIAEKAATKARAQARSKISAVRAVPASGDACKDAREKIRAYRSAP